MKARNLICCLAALFALGGCQKDDGGFIGGNPNAGLANLNIADAVVLYTTGESSAIGYSSRSAESRNRGLEPSSIYKITADDEHIRVPLYDKNGKEIEVVNPQLGNFTPELLCLQAEIKHPNKGGELNPDGTDYWTESRTWLVRTTDGAIFDSGDFDISPNDDPMDPFHNVDKNGNYYIGKDGVVIAWTDEYGKQHYWTTEANWRISTSESGGLSATSLPNCYAVDYDGNLWGMEGDYIPNTKAFFYLTAANEKFTSSEAFPRGKVIYGLSNTYNLRYDDQTEQCHVERIAIENGTVSRTSLHSFSPTIIPQEESTTWQDNVQWDLQNGYAVIYYGQDVVWMNGTTDISHTATDTDWTYIDLSWNSMRAGQWLYYYQQNSNDLFVMDLKTGATQPMQQVSDCSIELRGATGDNDGVLTARAYMYGKPTIATLTPDDKVDMIPVNPDSEESIPEVIEFVRVN